MITTTMESVRSTVAFLESKVRRERQFALSPERVRALTLHMRQPEPPPPPRRRTGPKPKIGRLQHLVLSMPQAGLIMAGRAQANAIAVTARRMGIRVQQQALGDGQIRVQRIETTTQP